MFLNYSNRHRLIRFSLLLAAIWLVGFVLFYLFLDQSLLLFIGEPSREGFRLAMREITNIGLGAHYFGGSALVYLGTSLLISKKARITKLRAGAHPLTNFSINKLRFYQLWSKNFFIALCFSGLANLIVKVIFGRQRPHKDPQFSNDIWNFFSSDWDFHSFPSGHTQVIFCAATMFSLAFPRGRIVFWMIAMIIGFSRIGTLYHFPSDVWTGAMIGFLFTLWSLHFSDRSGVLIGGERSEEKIQ